MLEVRCYPSRVVAAWQTGPDGSRHLELAGLDPENGRAVTLIVAEDACCPSCAIGDTGGAAIARPPYVLPLTHAGAAVPAWPLRQAALGRSAYA